MARFLLIPSFLIAGCVGSAIDTDIQATKDSVTAISQSLPASCKTDAITAQLKALDSKIDSIGANCKVQVAQVEAEKHTWQVATGALILLICLYIGMKLFK